MRARRWAVIRLRADRGSGAVLAIALALAIVVFALALMSLGAALAARQRVISAADAAALAGADAARGIVAGAPCETADRVAAANGAGLVACRVDGVIVTVEVGADVAGVAFRARSRAGPAP